jgi:ADP-ribose pyrophosphatase YjhB (NUDIX family)
MPSLAAFADRPVLTRRVTRETDATGLRALRDRRDRDLVWAVGALVEDDANRLLLVYEDDRWKLPGGGVEAGETRSEAVRREIIEETGVECRVDDLAAVTEVTVTHGEARETFFFGTYRATPETLITADDPGLDGEDIEQVAWRESVPEACLDRDLVARLRASGD